MAGTHTSVGWSVGDLQLTHYIFKYGSAPGLLFRLVLEFTQTDTQIDILVFIRLTLNITQMNESKLAF